MLQSKEMLAGFILVLVIAAPVHASASEASYVQEMDAGMQDEKSGDCAKAEQDFSQAARDAAAFGAQDARRGRALSDLGGVQSMLGNRAQAERSYLSALKAYPRGRKSDHADIGALWFNIGLLLGPDRDDSAEVDAFRGAVVEFKKTGDAVSLGKAYRELAGAEDFRSDPTNAVRHYLRAIALLRAHENGFDLSLACTNLALHYSALARRDSAWKYYRCALSAADRSAGLINRNTRTVLEQYAQDLRTENQPDMAKPIDAILRKIDALPPPPPGACQRTRVVTQ